MGAWGPGLYQNDVALDVKDTYEDLLHKGVLDEEITDRILEEYADSLIDADDGPVIWFALADIQQRRGRLDETVKEKTISFIDAGADLPAWKNAPESLQRKRTEALNKLKARLQSPQKPEKKIHHPRLYTCQWRIGDVYAYPLTSAKAQEAGLYGDMLLFHKCDNTTEWPGNILPVVRMKLYRNHDVPPTLSDFMVLCQDLEQYKVRKIRWFKRETRAVESVEKGRRLFHPSHSRAAATTRIRTDSAT